MPDATETSELIEKVIDAAPVLIGVTVDETMRPAVRAGLANSLRTASKIGAAPKEAAVTFRP